MNRQQEDVKATRMKQWWDVNRDNRSRIRREQRERLNEMAQTYNAGETPRW